MIVFPNCKINIGLRITGKRADGYHDIETIFYPLPFFDALEAVTSSQLSFSQTGKPLPESKNICLKAYKVFSSRFEIPALDIHLFKNIPAGAGLGGGSADGAFMLKLLSSFSIKKPGADELAEMALQLGSDCPFFLVNKPSFATGRGEMLSIIDLDLKGYFITIVNPAIHISTADAFRSISFLSDPGSLSTISKTNPEEWKDIVRNDFEEYAFNAFPEIAQLKSELYNAGAIYASMTGTGSTVYGIFRHRYEPVTFPASYFVRSFEL